MTFAAFGLVLVAAVTHSVWNILAAKSSGSGIPFLLWGAVFSTALWSIAIPFTGGFGAVGLGSFLLAVAVSGMLHVGYMLVLQRGYRAGELSTVYATARGSGPVLTVLASILVFGERPGPLALAGVALVIAGVVAFGLISRSGTMRVLPVATHRASGLARFRRLDPAIGYGLLTGVAIAAYTLWDVHTVNSFAISPVAFMVGTSAVQAVIFAGLLGGDRRAGAAPARRVLAELRGNWRGLIAFGVLSPLSYILVLTAATLAPLSLVAPIREVSVVLIGLYGVFRFRESRPVLRLSAAAVVVCGVVLIGL